MSDEPFRGQPDAVEIIARAMCKAVLVDPDEIGGRGEPFWTYDIPHAEQFIAALNAAGLVITDKGPREAMAKAWCVSQSGNADDPGPCYVQIDFTKREVACVVFEWLERMAGLTLPTLAADGSSKNPTEDRE